jgi:hypothetical protein
MTVNQFNAEFDGVVGLIQAVAHDAERLEPGCERVSERWHTGDGFRTIRGRSPIVYWEGC